jgi:hypothetical protein
MSRVSGSIVISARGLSHFMPFIAAIKHRHWCCHRACGSPLATKGHNNRFKGGLGHPSIPGTVVYTSLGPNRFKDFPQN